MACLHTRTHAHCCLHICLAQASRGCTSKPDVSKLVALLGGGGSLQSGARKLLARLELPGRAKGRVAHDTWRLISIVDAADLLLWADVAAPGVCTCRVACGAAARLRDKGAAHSHAFHAIRCFARGRQCPPACFAAGGALDGGLRDWFVSWMDALEQALAKAPRSHGLRQRLTELKNGYEFAKAACC